MLQLEAWGISLKLDRHGIRFNMWIIFTVFAMAIIVVFGLLQVLLIKPYYRKTQISTVKNVSDGIENYVISNSSSELDISKAAQLTVDSNVCVEIYNSQGQEVYDVDSIGYGCVFHVPESSIQNSPVSFLNPQEMISYLKENEGEVNINLYNTRTQQDMIVYGKEVKINLASFYIFVNSPLEPIDSIVSFFTQQYILYTFVVVILSSLVSLWIASKLSKPIVRMKNEANALASAQYNVEFDGGFFSETKELANTLNDATEKLSKIDELRKDLIANVSHDIKTPLTSIKAYAEMIKDISGDNPVKRNEHLDVIVSETDYLNRLVDDMNELSKMQSGNYVLKCTNFDLAQVTREMISLHQVMIDEGKLNIVVDVPETLIIYADEIKISQVIYNFLSNAIKHTPEGKSIYVKAYESDEGDHIHFEVRDEGEGIEEKDLPYIWDRYQKSSRSFSRSMTSTGLGLSIVKAILDAHGAKYGVKSKKDEGSTFYFDLDVPRVLEDIHDCDERLFEEN